LKQGYESQDAKLRAAILAQFPKINLGFGVARDTSDVTTIGPSATIDIPIFDRNEGTIASETATRRQLFDEYTSRVFAARSDVATAIVAVEALDAQIAASEASLPALENLVRIYQQAERRGDIDALSLYSSQNTLLQKKVDLGKLKQQLMQNWVALEIASGQYLPPQGGTTRPSTAPSAEARP
jgi:outer membrane protein TolC